MADRRILLVENDLILAWDLTEALESEGYAVRAVRTVAAAVPAADSWQPHLAIVDENAGSCTLTEAAALRAAVQGAVIRLGATQRLQRDEWAFAEVIGKPFLESELLAKLTHEFNRSRDLWVPYQDAAALVDVVA